MVWEGERGAFPANQGNVCDVGDSLELGLDARGEGVRGVDDEFWRQLFEKFGAGAFADGARKGMDERRNFLRVIGSGLGCGGDDYGNAECRDGLCDEVSVARTGEDPHAAGGRCDGFFIWFLVVPPEVAPWTKEESGFAPCAAISEDESGEHIELAGAKSGEGYDFDALSGAIGIANDATGG